MDSISGSFKPDPDPLDELDRIIPLDFNGVHELPESHTWTQPNDQPTTTNLSVPVIDLQDPDSKELIRQACEKWGLFQVTNHSVSASLLNRIDRQSRRLFALPAKRKRLVIRSPGGFTGYGVARIARFFPKLMWSEGFTAVGSPEVHACQLWPHDYTTFCDATVEYQNEMKGLADRMLGLMLKCLGFTREDLNWEKTNRSGSKPAQGLLQLNSYPVCPDPTRAMGLAPHTDSSLLTLLYQSNTAGLQVRHGDDGWVAVPPHAGALVVNVGDLMHILSNGRFKSAQHRAVVNKARHRISVAYFYGPPADVKIGPAIRLIDVDHPPIYRPVTWKEYLDVKAAYFNKALDLIRSDAFSTER
ncbi:gibberellin 3-beta-dioxygenase 3-like [Diospyros lotus]|uniref:gibberellin 3-beta-dioxygenase 3-like n=1 Tax=Diospyros lotus TaxID=55363 RepID=UPI00225BF2CA|nr:gibberellin 3-beta-dioxygenase 3-like [Diospyros lotus]